MSDLYNDGGLPHGSFAATFSDAVTRDCEVVRPSRRAKTINQYGPDGSPKKSVDVRDFNTMTMRIQVETQTVGVPDDMPAQGITFTWDAGYGSTVWRLQSIDGPGFEQGNAWVYETTWQMNEN